MKQFFKKLQIHINIDSEMQTKDNSKNKASVKSLISKQNFKI